MLLIYLQLAALVIYWFDLCVLIGKIMCDVLFMVDEISKIRYLILDLSWGVLVILSGLMAFWLETIIFKSNLEIRQIGIFLSIVVMAVIVVAIIIFIKYKIVCKGNYKYSRRMKKSF